MMEAELLASGFPRDRLEVVVEEQAAFEVALRTAKRGDLLLLFADKVSRAWKQVIYFKPESNLATTPGSSPPPGQPPAPLAPSALGGGSAMSDGIPAGMTVIEDERGVRLARETDD